MRDMLDSCSALRTRQLPVVLRNPGGHRTKHNGLKDIMKFYTLWILMTLFSQIWDDLSYHYYTIIIPLLTIIIPLLYHYYTLWTFDIYHPSSSSVGGAANTHLSAGASLMDTFSTTSPSGSSTSGSSTWAPHGSSLQTQLANAMGHNDTDSIYLSIYLPTYLSIDLSGYAYAYVGMYKLKYIYIYIVYIYVYTYVCIYGCIHSRTNTHTHMYIYINKHAWPFLT